MALVACDDWLNAARERGVRVDGEDGEILPSVLETIMPVLTGAFRSGLTTGHHAIIGGRYFIPPPAHALLREHGRRPGRRLTMRAAKPSPDPGQDMAAASTR